MKARDSIQRKTRYKNAGSIMPDAFATMYALEKVFHGLKEPKLLVTWLYFWLTNNLINYTHSAQTLTPPNRVRADDECGPNKIRIYYDGTESWVEFAFPYLDTKRNNIEYYWQPCPRSLNDLFHSVVSQAPLNPPGEPLLPILNSNDMATLTRFILKKQRKSPALTSAPITRKDNLHRYPSIALSVHPTLDNLTKYFCSRHHHHTSAHYYLSNHLSKIRYALYNAHNFILERLWQAVLAEQCLTHFQILEKNNHNKSTKTSIESLFRCQEAHYLTSERHQIHHYNRSSQNQKITLQPDIRLSNPRSVELPKIKQLFNNVHHYLSSICPNAKAPLKELTEYYNEVTLAVALQFIVLTSARPTHQIFPLRQDFSPHLTVIKDKGKYRQLYLNDFIVKTIERYVTFQTQLMAKLELSNDSRPEAIGFLFTQDGLMQPLKACDLQQFLKRLGQPFVTYQLRHAFAQFGMINRHPGLSTSLLDHIMGHSQYGEDIAHTTLFPAHYKRIQAHLNELTAHLDLKEFPL
ncbi:TPA: hypothetical protein AB5D21_003472 [Vibrio cholerae]